MMVYKLKATVFLLVGAVKNVGLRSRKKIISAPQHGFFYFHIMIIFSFDNWVIITTGIFFSV